jgi:hypothetical protein
MKSATQLVPTPKTLETNRCEWFSKKVLLERRYLMPILNNKIRILLLNPRPHKHQNVGKNHGYGRTTLSVETGCDHTVYFFGLTAASRGSIGAVSTVLKLFAGTVLE